MKHPSPSAPRAYNKADSILELAGSSTTAAAAVARIRTLADRLESLPLSAERRTVVAAAAADLLTAEAGRPSGDARAFFLRPHIVEEISRVSEERLADYLFYRYRYDVYPVTRTVDRFPPCVQIEPTSICNYRCVFCYQTDKSFSTKSHGHMGHMTLGLFKEAIDQIAGQVEAVTLASRGDPLICPDILPMLEYLHGKFLALKINTNAWFLDEEKAHAILAAEPNTLVFSADAADADLYAKLRVNGKLERVAENVRRFEEIRRRHYPNSKTITRVSGVRYDATAQDFDSTRRFWESHVDQVAFVDYNPWETVYSTPPNGVTTPCSDLWRRTFIWWDGTVNPCDVDYKSTLAMGRIGTDDLSGIWTGSRYTQLREAHRSGCRQDVRPCAGCVVV